MADPLDPLYTDQIKGFEGYIDAPYWDYKQYTSGYGTKAAGPDEKIDQATAEQRLSDSLAAAAAHVDSVNPNLPQGVRAALTSLTFNAGPGWANSGLGDLVRNGDIEGAKARFQEYNKAGGEVLPALVKRRAQEASWFGGTQPQPQNTAPAAPQIPANAPLQPSPQVPPIFPAAAPQQAPQQQAQPQPQMDFSAPPAMSPIFADEQRPIDISRLRAALQARGNSGLSYFRKS